MMRGKRWVYLLLKGVLGEVGENWWLLYFVETKNGGHSENLSDPRFYLAQLLKRQVSDTSALKRHSDQ